ncbi:hypothetical protein M662_16135 [Bacillus sp. SB49]|uniref:hypothetical protein n=1 Tax=Bacillus sp. SB49 TaxID=1071080 RepID=UPI0003FE001D|nr:hypothetical protein [Bacillus sp. SB49]QHT47946.1 hypothetical protein M662_16135 [Bacillus sp. SB49]
MEAISVILMSIGLILAPVVGFFYPAWRQRQGRDLSERQVYGIRALGIGILLLMYILTQIIRLVSN